MTLRIPLIATPSQSLTVSLGGQQCDIQIVQKYKCGVFLSMAVNGVSVISCVICRDRVSLVRRPYLPFAGTLAFIDTQGKTDPDYTGFGTRYQLAYIP